MIAIIALSIFVSAPGEPQVAWPITPVQLTPTQRSTFVTSVMARAPSGVVAERINHVDCAHVGEQVCCTTYTYDPITGAAIQALLAAGRPYTPGGEPGTQFTRWDPFCLVNGEVAGFDSFVRNIASELSNGPVIETSFVRTPGTVLVTMSGSYKKSMSVADCATYSDRTLIPVGIE